MYHLIEASKDSLLDQHPNWHEIRPRGIKCTGCSSLLPRDPNTPVDAYTQNRPRATFSLVNRWPVAIWPKPMLELFQRFEPRMTIGRAMFVDGREVKGYGTATWPHDLQVFVSGSPHPEFKQTECLECGRKKSACFPETQPWKVGRRDCGERPIVVFAPWSVLLSAAVKDCIDTARYSDLEFLPIEVVDDDTIR
jgi:hypothetical protein